MFKLFFIEMILWRVLKFYFIDFGEDIKEFRNLFFKLWLVCIIVFNKVFWFIYFVNNYLFIVIF